MLDAYRSRAGGFPTPFSTTRSAAVREADSADGAGFASADRSLKLDGFPGSGVLGRIL